MPDMGFVKALLPPLKGEGAAGDSDGEGATGNSEGEGTADSSDGEGAAGDSDDSEGEGAEGDSGEPYRSFAQSTICCLVGQLSPAVHRTHCDSPLLPQLHMTFPLPPLQTTVPAEQR